MKNYVKKVTKTTAKEIARQFFGNSKFETISEPTAEADWKDYKFCSGKNIIAIFPEYNIQEQSGPYINIYTKNDITKEEEDIGEATFVNGELKCRPDFDECRTLLQRLMYFLDEGLSDNGEIKDKASILKAIKLENEIDKKSWW